MTTTFQYETVTEIAQALSRVEAGATFDAQTDVTNWVLFGVGDVQFQITGPVDAATVNLQRSTIEPYSGSPNTTQVATATGNAGTVGVGGTYKNAAPSWFRIANSATFGPANTVIARTIQDLAAAINGLPYNFYDFAAGTVTVPSVAATYTATTLVLTARTAGTAGNAITTTETMTNGAWGAGTLAGGVALAAALGTLTFSTGAAANNDTVTINGRVYTFKTALTASTTANEVLRGSTLTNSRDNLLLAVNLTGTGATGVLTLATNVVAGDTVTIGNRIYTFVAVLDQNVPNQVFIGVDLTASRDNLLAAISGSVAGTAKYSVSTTPNSQVTAVATSTNAITVTAIVTGLAGQSIQTLETSSHASWGAAVLAGGTGAGITYGSATTINADVTAAAVSTNQMTATAKVSGAVGNAITTTESGANTAWGAATLASGADAVAATGTLTVSGTISNAETVTIAGVVYTFKTTLTPTAGEVKIAGTKANVSMLGVRNTNVG